MLRKWVEFVVRHPWVTISIILVITGFIVFQARKLQIHLEPDEQIPPEHPLVKIGQTIQKEFGGKYIPVIAIFPKKGTVFTKEIFRKIRAITNRANDLPGLRPNGVVSLVSDNFRDIRSSSGVLRVEPYVEDIPEPKTKFAELTRKGDHIRGVSLGLRNYKAFASLTNINTIRAVAE